VLRSYHCEPLRNSGGHEVWGCPCGDHKTSLPNHSKITAGVVKDMGNHLACLPKGWL
jgi:hypothetical protein